MSWHCADQKMMNKRLANCRVVAYKTMGKLQPQKLATTLILLAYTVPIRGANIVTPKPLPAAAGLSGAATFSRQRVATFPHHSFS
jgi:hypothetical protein